MQKSSRSLHVNDHRAQLTLQFQVPMGDDTNPDHTSGVKETLKFSQYPNQSVIRNGQVEESSSPAGRSFLEKTEIMQEMHDSPRCSSTDIDSVSLGCPDSSSNIQARHIDDGDNSPPLKTERGNPPAQLLTGRIASSIRSKIISTSPYVKLEPADETKAAEPVSVPPAAYSQMQYSTLTDGDDKKFKPEPRTIVDVSETRHLRTSGTQYYRNVPLKYQDSREKRKSWAFAEARTL